MLFLNRKIKEPQNSSPKFNLNCSDQQLNILYAIRPAGWAHFLLFPIAGWLFSRQPEPADLAAGLLSCALLLAHAYGFNNYKDNPGRQSSWWHRWPLIIFFGVVLSQKIIPQISAGVFLLISTIYSGRFKFKGLPVCGLALNGIGFALLTLLAVANLNLAHIWLFLMAGFWVSATQLIHEEAHLEQDTRCGYLTTAAILGGRKSRIVALVLLILALIFAFMLNLVFGLGLIVYIIIFTYLALRLEANQLRRAMKWLGLFWAGCAGWQFLF